MSKELRRAAAQLPPGTLVRVTWIDADQGLDTWCTPEEALSEPPTTVTSFGVVVGVRNGLLVIAGDSDGESINQVGRIPTRWLKSIDVVPTVPVHESHAGGLYL